jgi:putative transposase
MSVDEARELRELCDENAKLKRLVAESELEKMALKEIAKGKW